ncbi:hypothetical protein Atep_29950 (plasmid) [Allochromatium tepidum]|uniref:TraD/TraG TraM recognition site domain-containing protein n=2 Tax=Allochromatium tepidum TaxID=553982 RepID=A0ABM7QQT8_9GAMM|nr:hypothetical protein Atep_29950 [Allochromatium tepidum]
MVNARKFGGTLDTIALTGVGLTVLGSSPLLANWLPPLVVTGGAVVGGGWLGLRALDALFKRPMLKGWKGATISDAPVVEAKLGRQIKDALLLGYAGDTGDPIWINNEDAMRHLYIRGQSGVGKTVAASLMMFQQIQRGGGLLFMDGKIDADNLETLYQMASWCGREHDLEVINAGDPSKSNTYNPILFGDPDEVSARIIGLIPSTESNAGADYYKQSGNQGITTLVAALQAAQLAYNFIDLTILLMSPKALNYLESQVVSQVSDRHPAARALKIFLDQYRMGKEGVIDMKKLKEVFGGLGGRLYSFGTGKFGEVMNTYSPEVQLHRSIRENKITYIALPTMGKDVAANNFGKMAVGDFRTAVSWIQLLEVKDRPSPPYMGFFDEAGSYVSATWSRLFEQARSAHIMLMPAVQTDANFAAVSDELAEMIEGNTWVKAYFKLGSQGTAESAAEFIGKVKRVARSLSVSDSRSETSTLVQPSPAQSSGDSNGFSYTEREEEQYRVAPDDLKALGKGEAIILYGGDRVYSVKIPRLTFDRAFIDRVGSARINHPRPSHSPSGAYKRGINLFEQIDRFLSSTEREQIDREARN